MYMVNNSSLALLNHTHTYTLVFEGQSFQLIDLSNVTNPILYKAYDFHSKTDIDLDFFFIASSPKIQSFLYIYSDELYLSYLSL